MRRKDQHRIGEAMRRLLCLLFPKSSVSRVDSWVFGELLHFRVSEDHRFVKGTFFESMEMICVHEQTQKPMENSQIYESQQQDCYRRWCMQQGLRSSTVQKLLPYPENANFRKTEFL
jgi:hypothetical protein